MFDMLKSAAALRSQVLLLSIQISTCLITACFQKKIFQLGGGEMCALCVCVCMCVEGYKMCCISCTCRCLQAQAFILDHLLLILSDCVPLVGFAQVICSITAREVISRKLLGKFPFAAKMYYLVERVLFSWERRLSIWIVGRPVLAIWG